METHSRFLAWRIPMDRGAWRVTAHRVAKSQTRLKRQHTHTHTHTMIVTVSVAYPPDHGDNWEPHCLASPEDVIGPVTRARNGQNSKCNFY